MTERIIITTLIARSPRVVETATWCEHCKMPSGSARCNVCRINFGDARLDRIYGPTREGAVTPPPART